MTTTPFSPALFRRAASHTGWMARGLVAIALLATPLVADDAWELPPVSYSDTAATDAISVLAADLASGKRQLSGKTAKDKLVEVLDLLGISADSQMLVFSKTSHQNKLIFPSNPRSLYFNENAYVGYVPGGEIEIITHDPVLGVVFHLIDPGQTDPARMVERDSGSCLSCHGTTQTESVPGLLVRSVHPDENGHLLLPLGTSLIDGRSPLKERWGGYYVTGTSSLPHLGNRTYRADAGRQEPSMPDQLDDLSGKIDVTKYPRPTSDIVSLLVLEHQCRVHNLLIAASMNYRRSFWLEKSVNPDRDPDQGRSGKLADDHALRIVDALLFKDEADLGAGGVDGSEAFQDSFLKRFPKASDGKSLADFHLGRKLFKHPCSYMVYSQAFAVLPPRVKSAVIARLHEVLEGGMDFPEIQTASRERTAAILRETLPGW